MSERIGKEQLLAMQLQGTPDRFLDAMVSPSAEDTADLIEIRETLADLALSEQIVAPPPRLLARILASARRPLRPTRPVLMVLDMIEDHLTPGRPLEVPRARTIVPALRDKIAASRAKSMPVIYVCDQHEEGDPDLKSGVWGQHALAGTPGASVVP